MKVKIIKDNLILNVGTAEKPDHKKKGDALDVTDNVGKQLIDQGYVQAVDAKEDKKNVN
ncbi:hypothetical protein [Paenibacillus lutimineralis]|uniref:hypothetical protein n=1 Tax=Paenibacillus lutimineralis TaxID=2707005 RepID=UPI0013A67F4F|nr:hypothetical protein [Paenibacillus lutimineralis]